MSGGRVFGAVLFLLVALFAVSGFVRSAEALDRDANGWSILNESADTRKVYVSSSEGNDNNDGLSEANPVATISQGLSLLRDGYPDWLLLKRGDVWYENLQDLLGKSGRSESERMVVTTYGSSGARPLLKTGSSGVLNLAGNQMSHVAFVGLDCYAHTRDPDSPDYSGYDGSTGFRLVGSGSNILWEDCIIRFYTNNFTVQTYPDGAPHFTNVELRRCMLLDSYSTTGHSQGIYGQKIDGLLFEECFFDHCGWLIQGDGGQNRDKGKATMYNHSTYLNTCTDVTFRGNITLRPSSIHNKFTMDGTANLLLENNLYVDGEIIASIGGNDSGPYRFTNVTFRDNVAHLIGESQPTGRTLAWGLDMINWAAGSVATIANGETSAAVLEGFTIQNGSASDGGGVYCSNTSPTIRSNVITANVTSGDGGGIYCHNSTPAIVNNTIADNVVVYETCAGGAIRVLGESAAPTVTNCLLWGNTAGVGDQIAIKTGATLTVSYSDVQGGQAGVAVQTADCTLSWGSGNMDNDPQFVDAANDDYHIGSGSPCIDAADGYEAPATDMEGNGRVDDPNTTNTGTGTPDYADVGPYEYQGS